MGPFGEAILDPRFITHCSLHPKNSSPSVTDPEPVPLPKIKNPLFTIEKIIESELRSFSASSGSSGSEEEISSSVPVSPEAGTKTVRCPVGSSDAETDEGFYDKPSISPTNSID